MKEKIVMRRKPIQTLSFKQLEVLPTKALLGRLKRLQQCEESFELSDRDESELVESNEIQFKQTPEWKSAYEELKDILKGREHVPKGKVLKELRLKKHRRQKNI